VAVTDVYPILPAPPTARLFPYTTRFRSSSDRIVSPIRKTDTKARDIEATSVDFPIHPDVRRAIAEARRSSLRVGRCPFIVHRVRSEEHTSELQSRENLVCRLLLEKKKTL